MAISEQMYLKRSRDLAKIYGHFIVVKPDSYLLYREAYRHNVFVGKRKKAATLYSFIKQVTGHK